MKATHEGVVGYYGKICDALGCWCRAQLSSKQRFSSEGEQRFSSEGEQRFSSEGKDVLDRNSPCVVFAEAAFAEHAALIAKLLNANESPAVETPAEPTAPLRDFNRYLDHMHECAFLRDADSASPTYGKCTCGLNELIARLTVKTSGGGT